MAKIRKEKSIYRAWASCVKCESNAFFVKMLGDDVHLECVRCKLNQTLHEAMKRKGKRSR